nr:MAG TPA: hypothetical protein [Bacteriophage sp.]
MIFSSFKYSSSFNCSFKFSKSIPFCKRIILWDLYNIF